MSGNLDNTVLTGFQNGNDRSFQRVLNYFYPSLYNFTQKMTGDREEAKDITLHAFQKLFERCKFFETETNIKAFLYITARNKSLDFLNAQKRKLNVQKEMVQEMSNDILLRYEYDIMDELVDRLNIAIEGLPPESQKIFKLLYYEQMTPSEIADHLRLSVQTVYTQKNRAIKALRLLLLGKSLSLPWLLVVCNYLSEKR